MLHLSAVALLVLPIPWWEFSADYVLPLISQFRMTAVHIVPLCLGPTEGLKAMPGSVYYEDESAGYERVAN